MIVQFLHDMHTNWTASHQVNSPSPYILSNALPPRPSQSREGTAGMEGSILVYEGKLVQFVWLDAISDTKTFQLCSDIWIHSTKNMTMVTIKMQTIMTYDLLLAKLSPLVLSDTSPISKHWIIFISAVQFHILQLYSYLHIDQQNNRTIAHCSSTTTYIIY